jgi:predicted ATPase/transcriptional regulator with XRE-family HTH domain
MESSASFGDWLRRRRKALDLTQDTLAEQVGCSVGLIRKIEGDERRPSRQVAELLANVLQITPNEREKFIQVARAQLRTQRLESIDPPQDALPATATPQTNAPAQAPSVQPNTAQATPTQSFNLPIPPTPLIGRERELATLQQLLANPECRLLTLVGPGGMGTTRLALAVATSQQPRFAQGAVFVALAGLNSSEFIAPTLANALGLVFAGSTEPQSQLLNHLREKQLLLVLDNLEHLLAGVDLLTELLVSCAGLKLLVTSRERLNLQGEWVFDLQGLALPVDTPSEQSAQSSAMRLFLASAQRSHASFALTEKNLRAIVQICRLVEGMPLAIELAAAWVPVLSCQEIAQEIERTIDFLAVSHRDMPARHRSLRATFDYSWKLLTPDEQQVLARLTIFRGGFRRDAAMQIAGASLHSLSVLVQKSLLHRLDSGRYDLHELVRQYAKLQLAGENGDAARFANERVVYQLGQTHARYYLGLVERLAALLYGPEQQTVLQELKEEQDNLRLAFAWVLTADISERTQQVEIMLHVAGQLARFWHGHALREGRHWLEQGLASELTLNPRINPRVRAHALAVVAWLARTQGDFAQTDQLLTESLEIYRQIEDAAGEASTLDTLGDVALARGHSEQAQKFYQESLALFRVTDNQRRIPLSLCSLGDALFAQGDFSQATGYYRESLALSQPAGDERGCALALYGLGICAVEQAEVGDAIARLHQALTLFTKLGNQVDMVLCLANLALVATLHQQAEPSLCLWAAAEQQAKLLQISLPASLQNRWNGHLAHIRGQMDERSFSNNWQRGQAMALEEAAAYALSLM